MTTKMTMDLLVSNPRSGLALYTSAPGLGHISKFCGDDSISLVDYDRETRTVKLATGGPKGGSNFSIHNDNASPNSLTHLRCMFNNRQKRHRRLSIPTFGMTKMKAVLDEGVLTFVLPDNLPSPTNHHTAPKKTRRVTKKQIRMDFDSDREAEDSITAETKTKTEVTVRLPEGTLTLEMSEDEARQMVAREILKKGGCHPTR